MFEFFLDQSIVQHTKCIVRSMIDSNFRKFYNMVKLFDPRNDDELTMWVDKIRNAKLSILSPNTKWKKDDTLIQVKKMCAKDLKDPNVLPTAKHAFEETLHAFKLPLPIPTEKLKDRSEFLFIRPDEYELFIQFGVTVEESILLGNPGISKSWFQWKFILFCYRPDIFNELWKSERVKGIVPEENVDGLEESEPIDPFFMPEMIVRTIAGKKSHIFSIKQNYDVLELSHNPKDLKKFTPPNSTLLWEPEEDHTPVKFSGIKGHIIATLSPNEDRYHDFAKKAKKMFMPCPSEIQLRLMGKIFRGPKDIPDFFLSDKEIHNRVVEYGPFIRSSLLWSHNELKDFREKREKDIDRIWKTESSLSQSLRSSDQIIEAKLQVPEGCTHRLAVFSVERSSQDRYYLCSRHFEFSCPTVVNIIYQRIAQFDLDILKKHLKEFNNGVLHFDVVLPKYLELICVAHSVSKDGFTWKAFPMAHRPNVEQDKSKRAKRPKLLTSEWQPFFAQFDRMNRAITAYKDMKRGVLYYPSDASFPLVDMYYKAAGNKLIGIQATIGQRHEKPFSVYKSFYRKLKINAKKCSLQLFYLILPRMLQKYAKDDYPPSQFFTDVTSNTQQVEKWTSHIDFYILLPPDDFEATFLEEFA